MDSSGSALRVRLSLNRPGFLLGALGLGSSHRVKGACTAARDIRWRTRGPTGPRGTNSSRALAGCRDSLGLEKGEATPITQLTTRKFIAVRLVRVGAWAMGSCAIVAVEENDRVYAQGPGKGREARIRWEKSGASPAANAASLIRERRRSSSKGKVLSTSPAL